MIRLAPSRPIAPRLIACLASFVVVLAALAAAIALFHFKWL